MTVGPGAKACRSRRPYGRALPRFYIRGLGNTDFDPNAAQPVSVVVDDVPIDNAVLRSFPIFDTRDVEVLRGPQGTLFGRNTPAGVVKLDSVRPSDVANGYADVSWGTYNTVNAQAAIGGPLADGFTFRLAGILQRRDNWINNTDKNGVAAGSLGGFTDGAVRLMIGYSKDNFDGLLTAHGRSEAGQTQVYYAGSIQPGSNSAIVGFNPDTVSHDGVDQLHMHQDGYNLHLNYKIPGFGVLSDITSYEWASGYSASDVDGGSVYAVPPVGLGVAKSPSNTGGAYRPEEFSEELRLVTGRRYGVQVQAGVYYLHQLLYYTETTYDTTGHLFPGEVTHDDTNQNVGVYASAEYQASSALTFRAGLRWSQDNKHDFVGQLNASTPPGLTAGLTLPIVTTTGGSNVSWDASATYVVTPDTNLYARVATGYLGAAIQDRVTNGSKPVTALPETTISGEFGLKGAYFDKRLSASADVYYMDTHDLQLTAVGGATNSAHLINVDDAITSGVEVEFRAKPIHNLVMTVGGSYNYSRIEDPTASVSRCGSGVCHVTDPLNSAGRAILNGNDLPQAPRVIVDATAGYTWPLTNGDSVFAYTDWSYRGAENFKLYTATEFVGAPLTLGGVKVGYRTSGGTEVSVFVRNILNQIVFVRRERFQQSRRPSSTTRG